MPTPRALSGRSASNSRCTSSAGSEAEGSSRTRTSACTLSARAMATSDFSVRVRSRTRIVGASGQSTWASAASRRRLDRAPVDEAEPARIAGRERDVLGDRHPFDEAEVLMDEGDGLALAEAGRTVAVALAAILDRAFGRLDDAAERLDQGGLSRRRSRRAAPGSRRREDRARRRAAPRRRRSASRRCGSG